MTLYEETLNVTKTLLNKLSEYMGSYPLDDGNGNVIKEKIFTHLIKDIDFDLVPNNPETNKAELPSVAISLPSLQKPMAGYQDNTKETIGVPSSIPVDKDEYLNGKVRNHSIFLDHVYRVRLSASDTITLLVLIRMFANAFNDKLSQLTIYEDNDHRCYDIDVTEYPSASSSVANQNSLYEATAEIAVRGVEFNSDIVKTYPLIHEFNLVTVGISQTAVIDENGNIIIQEAQSG